MPKRIKTWLKPFLLELFVYSLLVTAYYFFVLHVLGDRVAQLYHDEKRLYAVVAVALIAVQGIVLELVTRGLLALFAPRTED